MTLEYTKLVSLKYFPIPEDMQRMTLKQLSDDEIWVECVKLK